MYLASERKEYILKVLADRGSVRTVVLSKEMNVTDETVRNDLISLEHNGLLKRVHGGAISLNKKALNATFMGSVDFDVNIAKTAASMIEPGKSAFIDGGALGHITASHITAAPATIVTNSHSVMARIDARENLDVFCTGGLLDRDSGLLLGTSAAKSLQYLGIDMAFIIPDAYCPIKGAGYNNLQHAEFIQEIAAQTKTTIVLCPANKLNTNAAFFAVSPDKIDTIITNEKIDDDVLAEISKSGVKLEQV